MDSRRSRAGYFASLAPERGNKKIEGPPVGIDLVHARCPVCGHDDSLPIHRERGFTYVACRRDGTVYLNPRPAPDAVIRHYDEYLPSSPEAIGAWRDSQAPVARRTAKILSSLIPPGSRVLDAGCGFGFAAAEMIAAGFDAEGLEISEAGAAHARSLGVTVHETTLEGAAFPRESFDAVCALYVIEHLHDPGAFLRQAAGILKPGRPVLLRWPQSAPLVRWCRLLGIRLDLFDAPSHLTDFSTGGLHSLLEKSGFEAARTWPCGSTAPAELVPRLAGLAGALAGDLLYFATGGRVVIPGASRTTVAFRSREHAAKS